MAVTSTANIAKLLAPGLNQIWGEYQEYQGEYRDLFEVQTSDKQYEEDQLIPGLGYAPAKPQGSPVTYDTLSQGLTSRYTHIAYGLGFMLTREALKDNQYKGKALKATKMLARSHRQTKETVAAYVYNRGHNASYTGADGVVLFSTAHPTLYGNQSNRLTTAADLSEASLEDLCVLIAQAVDERGIKAALKPRSLHVSTSDMFNAARILKSVGQNDSANNAINAMRSMGLFPEGAKVNHFFDDADACFVRTDADQGMVFFQREEPEFDQDNDFDTSNLKYKSYERFSAGWTDFRGAFSNGGGA